MTRAAGQLQTPRTRLGSPPDGTHLIAPHKGLRVWTSVFGPIIATAGPASRSPTPFPSPPTGARFRRPDGGVPGTRRKSKPHPTGGIR